MIARVALEPVGDQLLLRIATESAAFDILTDSTSLQRALELVQTPAPEMTDVALGSFGPFQVTVTVDATDQVGIALEGPDLGPAVGGKTKLLCSIRRFARRQTYFVSSRTRLQPNVRWSWRAVL